MYKLQLFDAADPTQPIDARLFAEGSMTIGRDPRANWSIDDPNCALSRWHCELFARPEGLALSAMGANGVFFEDGGERLPDGAETLLPLPCGLELGSFRLVASLAPFHAEQVDPAKTLVLTPPVGLSAEVPTEWQDASIAPDCANGSLLEAFCQGAGLDSSLLSGEEPEEIMRRAAAIYRQMVLGIGDLMADRIERGAGEGRAGRAERQARDRRRGGGVPPRRAEAAEGRHDMDALGRRRPCGEIGERLGRDAHEIGDPDQGRAGRADVAFEGERGFVEPPGERQADAGPGGTGEIHL